MNGTTETKSEIRARIEELERLMPHMRALRALAPGPSPTEVINEVDKRLQELHRDLDSAEEDLSSNILKSHKALCEVKNMTEKEAYGNDPALFYTLGICGEAGEMANKIVKAMRNKRGQKDQVLSAIVSELPDVVIYSYVLAHVMDIDLSKLVNEKVGVVVQRAIDGYYGGPLER